MAEKNHCVLTYHPLCGLGRGSESHKDNNPPGSWLCPLTLLTAPSPFYPSEFQDMNQEAKVEGGIISFSL